MDERTLVFVVLWTTGLAAGFWMVRRGHDPRWIYLGAVLGPLFVPIAVERVRNHPAVVGDSPVPVRNGGLRVLVGYDGSPESQDAVAAAHRLIGEGTSTLVLAQVVSYDAAEDETHADVDAARHRLAEAVAALSVPGAAFEVLAGPPAKALCSLADEQDMDLLVVGRRGRGLSQRVLGSVAERVVKNARLPVLVAHSPGARPALRVTRGKTLLSELRGAAAQGRSGDRTASTHHRGVAAHLISPHRRSVMPVVCAVPCLNTSSRPHLFGRGDYCRGLVGGLASPLTQLSDTAHVRVRRPRHG